MTIRNKNELVQVLLEVELIINEQPKQQSGDSEIVEVRASSEPHGEEK